MKKISSGQTYFIKRLFPTIWFGFFVCSLAIGIVFGAAAKVPFMLVVPFAMGAFGYVLFKNLLWDLADEVYDCGDSLLIRMGGQEDRIALSNVMNVSATTLTNPPRVTLRLVEPGLFGDEVTFSPATGFRLNPFARNPIVDDLIVRVHATRSARR